MKKAVALLYDRKKAAAPLVAASGQGQIAGTILALAEQAGIPIRQDPDLVEVLSRIPVGEEIPVELYQAVAEILAFIVQLDEKSRRTGLKMQNSSDLPE